MAQDDVKAGEEFTIYYGQRPNYDLFLYNGFVVKGRWWSLKRLNFVFQYVLQLCFKSANAAIRFVISLFCVIL